MSREQLKALAQLVAGWPDALTPGTDVRLMAALDALLAVDPHDAWYQASNNVIRALSDALLDLAPEGRRTACGGDFMAAQEAFAALGRWLKRHRRANVVLAAETQIATEIQRRAERVVDRVKLDLDGEDHPDLRRIGLEMMKLELFQWLLEPLGRSREIAQIEFLAGHVGRLAVRRVTRIADAVTRGRGLDARLDMVITLAHVDELILLAEKVLVVEAAERQRQPDPLVDRIGLDTVQTFIRSLRAFTPILLEEIEQRLDPASEHHAFLTAWLRKIELIWRFAAALDHPSVQVQVQEFRTWMTDRIRQLQTRIVGA